MATVVVTVATSNQDFPLGTVVGKLRIALGSVPGAVQDVDGLTASFSDIGPGDYVAIAQSLDSNGNELGTPVSTAFTVPVPAPTTVSLPVASAVVVTVG